jgi:hypothetical protein
MTQLTETFVQLVERYAEIWHNGHIPTDRVAFVAKLLDAYMPASMRELSPFTTEEWLRERDSVAEHLAAAVDCVARSQEARWTN